LHRDLGVDIRNYHKVGSNGSRALAGKFTEANGLGFV
jgi:hypothetical protein